MGRPRKNDQQSGEDSEEEVQSICRGLPIEFKDYIRAAKGDESVYIDDGVLAIQKPLSKRDVDPQKGRFSFPSSSLMKNYVQNDGSIVLIEPSVQKDTLVYFRVKKKKNKNPGKKNTMYVLDTSWNEVVTRNNLEAGQIVQLWAIQVDDGYCFALHRLTTEEGNSAPGTSVAAANPAFSSSSDS